MIGYGVAAQKEQAISDDPLGSEPTYSISEIMETGWGKRVGAVVRRDDRDTSSTLRGGKRKSAKLSSLTVLLSKG